LFFFFQAEDGIRDLIVTGVQTCALPICEVRRRGTRGEQGLLHLPGLQETGSRLRRSGPRVAVLVCSIFLFCSRFAASVESFAQRSEERRVGKGWSVWWWSVVFKEWISYE